MMDNRRWISILLVLGLFLSMLAGAVPAQAATLWSTAGALSQARRSAAAVLLPDGRVLVVGGDYESGGSVLYRSSAEIFTPLTGAWNSAGNMGQARTRATATLLPNGKVLVVGGSHPDAIGNPLYLASAELYDSTTHAWSTTGSLSQGRAGHTATLLADGRVLIIGGQTGLFSYTASVEVYDPTTESFTSLPALTLARGYHTATLLADGRILVVGGHRYVTTPTTGLDSNSSVVIYDPDTGASLDCAAISGARSRHTATLLHTGKVLVAGGIDHVPGSISSYRDTAYLFDPAAPSAPWVAAGMLGAARANHTAALLPDGRLLAVGGDAGGAAFLSVDVYDPVANSWAVASEALSAGRTLHTTTFLPNGQVLVAGGSDGTTFRATAELRPLPMGAWSRTGDMVLGRVDHRATLLRDGRVLVTGGQYTSNAEVRDSAELYTPSTGLWATTTMSMTAERYGHTATLLRDGQVLVTGGYGRTGEVYQQASCELFSPVANTWTATGSMHDRRQEHTATLLADGRVLVAGGYHYEGSLIRLNTAEIYTPASGEWTEIASMSAAHSDHTATLLQDGRVLVIGGAGAGGVVTDTFEIYNPATGQWSRARNANLLRRGHTATLLPNGKVLVAGGHVVDTSPLNTAVIYTPSTNSWATTGNLVRARTWHEAIGLPDGRVMLIGGSDAGDALRYVEVWDPVTGVWSALPLLVYTHASSAAVLLLDGRVLLAGGRSSTSDAYRYTEVYTHGLGIQSAWRPAFTGITSPLRERAALEATGALFRGGTGASGGGLLDSATGYPLMLLRRIDSGQVLWLSPADFTNTGYLSRAVSGFPWGPATVTAFVNGIPGVSKVIDVGDVMIFLPLALRNL